MRFHLGVAVVCVLTCGVPAQKLVRTPSQVGIGYDIVAVRMPKQAVQQQEHFQDAFNMSLFIGRGAELVIIHPDGSEELLFSGGPNASATDPFVSYDGRTVYFSLFVDPEDINPQRFLSYSPAHIWKVDVATKQATQLTFGTSPAFRDSARRIDPRYALFDVAPIELPDGRILFLSTRDGQFSVTGRWPAPVFWRMNPDGSNLERMEWFSQAGCQHPFILKDGRIIWTHRHNAGRRQIGGHNYALMAANQDLSDIQPFAGLHYRASAWHFATELSGGDIVTAVYYHGNNFGHGTLVRFPVDGQDPSGHHFYPADKSPLPGQTNSYGVNDHYRRVAEQLVGSWQLAPTGVLAYDAASPFLPSGARAGKSTMPAAIPGGHMLFVWSPGEVHVAGGEDAVPDMKICFGKDGWLNSPDDVIILAQRPSHHYMHPKPLVPYYDIHGVARPARLVDTPNDGSSHPVLPAGAPLATTGTSSVYNRESGWPNSYTDAWSQPLINNYGQITAYRNLGQDSYPFPDSEIWAAQVVVDMARVDTRYGSLNGNLKTHNIGDQIWGVLGEVPLRKTDAQGRVILDPNGDPDTSYEVLIPANVPFHHRIIDRNGVTLTAEQTWHSARPGERKTNCGGCHAHSVESMSLPFSQTVAGQPGYSIRDFAFETPMVGRDAQGNPTVNVRPEKVRVVEYFRDVKPIFDAKCVSCHSGASPAAGLNLQVTDAWEELAYRRDNAVPYPSGHQATRYVRYNSAAQSSLVWKVFGTRLDGRANEDRTDDWDYTGSMMPPPGSPPLTFEEKRTIAMWVDLGCLVDLTPGVAAVADPFDDQMKPTLVVGGIEGDHNEAPLPPLTVSAFDVHSDIDPSSLSVVITRADGQVSPNLANGINAVDGTVYSFDLDSRLGAYPDREHTVDISVADTAGNIARRTLKVTPLTLRFSQGPWVIGSKATLTVDGARPGELVYFMGSFQGPGIGPALFPHQHYGGVFSLDLVMPISIFATVPADARGTATIDLAIPIDLPPLAYHTQAMVLRGRWLGWSLKTRPMWADVQ